MALSVEALGSGCPFWGSISTCGISSSPLATLAPRRSAAALSDFRLSAFHITIIWLIQTMKQVVR